MRRILLPAAYYLLVTPFGMLRRLAGRSMEGRRQPQAPSYLVFTQRPGA